MGVMVDGVEIPIQIGQVWGCDSVEQWTVKRPVEDDSCFKWVAQDQFGAMCAFTDEGCFWPDMPENKLSFRRLLSGPGAPEAPKTDRWIVQLSPTLHSEVSEETAKAWEATGAKVTRVSPAPEAQPAPAQAELVLDFDACGNPMTRLVRREPAQPSPAQPGVTRIVENAFDFRRRHGGCLFAPQAPAQPDVTAELRALVEEAWDIMREWPEPKMGNPMREIVADDYRAWRKRAKVALDALSGEPQAPGKTYSDGLRDGNEGAYREMESFLRNRGPQAPTHYDPAHDCEDHCAMCRLRAQEGQSNG